MTSLSQLAEREITVEEMAPFVAHRFEEVFDRRLELGQRDWPLPALAISAVPAV